MRLCYPTASKILLRSFLTSKWRNMAVKILHLWGNVQFFVSMFSCTEEILSFIIRFYGSFSSFVYPIFSSTILVYLFFVFAVKTFYDIGRWKFSSPFLCIIERSLTVRFMTWSYRQAPIKYYRTAYLYL